MIDMNRIDITKPIDLSVLCNTGLYNIKPEDKHFGVNLIDEVSFFLLSFNNIGHMTVNYLLGILNYYNE